jgi:hypothetical protein
MIFEYPILLQKFRIFTLISFFKTIYFFSPRFLTPLRVAPPRAQDIPKKKHATLLDVRKLDEQESLFICKMESNARKIMDDDIKTINPLTKLWQVVENNSMLCHDLSEYIQLAEVAAILVLGSVEDDRTFSTLLFMKDKLRN